MAITTSDRMVMLWRGLTRRCPRCESGGLFRHWVEMVDDCPRCGLIFEREEGYWLGAIYLNTFFTGAVLTLLLAVVGVLSWPHIPMTPMIAIGLPLGGALPILFYPSCKTFWLAIDLCFLHPLRPWRRRRREQD
ncbi:MAG TPA: DUF983 domain-containing protein [Thermomicrobiales bacterium]|nr:DUF983 domain-containing protein [Thermomicrobiales bacterium]